MPIDERWSKLSQADWVDFAQAWLATLRGTGAAGSDVGQAVVLMNFTATPDQQLIFIEAAVEHAATDEELGHIAAGPIEHLLGFHGEQVIDRVERLAEENPRFARMLTAAWQHTMSESIWARVQALQAKADPIE